MQNHNKVVDPNPYGPVETEDIERFERSLPSHLPDDYKAYLLYFNGGTFEKTYLPVNSGTDDFCSISEFFALFRGPEGSRLEQNWDLAEFYDLQDFRHLTKAYLAFGLSGTGDIFLMKFGTGEVLIYLHDHMDDTPAEGPGGTIFPVAGSFTEFVSKAISNEDRLKIATENDLDFARRLDQLKKESGLWD